MKSFAVLAFAGLAAAQFSALPTCAQQCANTFLQKGIGNCGVDVACICADTAFLGGIACCLAQPGGCGATDQTSAVVFASQLCAAQGVTVPTAVVCSTTASSGATASATPASTEATATGTTAKATATNGTVTSTHRTSSASASATTKSSAAWAPRETAGFGGLVGGIMAVLALL